MRFSPWQLALRRIFGSRPATIRGGKLKRNKHHFAPWLERLEDRLTPAAFAVHTSIYPIPVATADGWFPRNSVSSNAIGSFSGLSLAPGQATVIDVGTTPVLKLAGDLNNQGTIYLVSTNPLVRSVSLSAQNILNGAGARITTVLPPGGLAGYSNAVNNLSLTLIAAHNIVSQGSITSAATLTALAGGTITNAPAVRAGAGAALLQAVGDLNLLAPAVVDQGLVSSTGGNVNVDVPSIYRAAAQAFAAGTLPAVLPPVININDMSGTVQAFQGMINIGGMDLDNNALLSVTGGNLAAKAINLQAGSGSIRVNVQNVTGSVNVSGGSAQFFSIATILDLGNVNVTGDPTFFNKGNIQITGNITEAEGLAILATGNITASTAVTIRSGGNNVYIVAGANLTTVGAPTGTPTLTTTPPDARLQPGQSVLVSGASDTGGTISLHGSTINTRPPLLGNGGNVTLVAYAGSIGGGATGGISDVNIFSGGAGNGTDGSATLIAGGTVQQNIAISEISINASGGTGMPPAGIGMYAVQPTGAVRFDNHGVADGNFSPGVMGRTLTTHDILPGSGSGIITDGGTITIKTGGAFSNQEVLSSSGVGARRDAGDITIIAGSIDVRADLLAVGSNGSTAVLPGRDGGNGGKGGRITLQGTAGITVNANIKADAGNGGNGAKADDAAIGAGGTGGRGGNGDMAGAISLTTKDAAVTQAAKFVISAVGGSGGNGGNGGAGGSAGAPNPKRGNSSGNGGAGGNGGQATAGGSLQADAGAGTITFAGKLDFNGGGGGIGGGGGNGGNAVAANVNGGIGGATGVSQNGAMGGMIQLKTTSGDISLAMATANGGAGPSQTATSGRGGSGSLGGNGGAVATCGAGAQGGQMLVLSTSGTVTVTDSITLNGGAGGSQASTAPAGGGGTGSVRGGNGGTIGNGGDGAIGGLFSISTAGDVTISGTINADGGSGGAVTSTAGNGGRGPDGGFGGSVGNAGGGGEGGSVSITSNDGFVLINKTKTISAVGGAGGINSGAGGTGGMGTTQAGGRGGSVGDGIGGGGAGGKGGDISISSGSTKGTLTPITSPITIRGQLLASGGAGGALTATGGNGGQGTGKASGGAGGSINNAGAGGGGGSVLVTGKDSINLYSVVISGGAGGGLTQDPLHSLGGTGGQGGSGPAGGDGGGLGASGSGGGGGKLIVKTSLVPPKHPGTITVVFNDIVNAGGGAAGIYTGIAGNGGNASGAEGSTGNGGNGGGAGDGGNGGDGGTINVTGLGLHINPTGALLANGGDNGVHPFPPGIGKIIPGYKGRSGNGGNGGGDVSAKGGNGGNGGRVGIAGSGGKGGDITLNVPGALTVEERKDPVTGVTFDSIAARGGLVSNDLAVSGQGGAATLGILNPGGAVPKGGDGGEIGHNGSGGKGGDITIVGDSGNMTGTGVIVAAGGSVYDMAAQSGAGGYGGNIGRGGNSGEIKNNGDAGDGGRIIISSASGNIGLSPLIVPGGDLDGTFMPQTGNGGDGGSVSSVSGDGGNSGDIGTNGKGGDGGLIKITSDSGNIDGNINGDGTIQQAASATTYVAAGGVVAPTVYLKPTDQQPIIIQPIYIYSPSQAKTGNGGNAVVGKGGNSGKIGTKGTNGPGGKGGEVILTTSLGNIITPRGGILTAGGDGGTSFDQTGNGGNSKVKGNGGNSGDIGKNSDGGNAGPITLKSTFGNITVGGVLILRGAIASNSGDRTGDGGTAQTGSGGTSGAIGSMGKYGLQAGGTAGDAGKLSISAGGTIIISEAIVATGGDAGALSPYPPPGLPPGQTDFSYKPITGDGGNGIFQGGNAGNIGMAGVAGKGGEVDIKAASPPPSLVSLVSPGPPDIETNDRILVNGGRAGTDPSNFPGVVFPAGDGVQRGYAGSGGTGGAGGNGGSVGGGVVGGAGNKIQLSAQGAISKSADYRANGGNGGDQAGTGGQGGAGTRKGGTAGYGGAVNAAGNGGDAGTIILLAEKEVTLKELGATGGSGGDNNGIAGNGGNGLTTAGNGGMLAGSGAGGKGGTLVVKTPPLATPTSPGRTIDVQGNQVLNFSGGNGGNMGGTAGNGGNGMGDPRVDSQGGDGGKCLDSGAGGPGGSITLESVNGTVALKSEGASVNGGNSGSYSATSGNGGNSTGTKPGGRGGDSGGQGDAGGAVPFNPRIMTISIETGSFSLHEKTSLTANGGNAQVYVNHPGSGGNGGGPGGTGGNGGRTGSGGLGGAIKLTTTNQLNIDGLLSANGGDRNPMSVSSGNGGDGGTGGTSTDKGQPGGDAGTIVKAGSAGGGGTISLQSEKGEVTSTGGTGLALANGGHVSFQPDLTGGPVMQGGNGGRARAESSQGGAGGATAFGPGTGAGGKITVDGDSGITLPNYQANGGSFFGIFTAMGGNGGDSSGDSAAGTLRSGGGIGGFADNSGSGGKGGDIILNSDGNIAIGTLSAAGSSVGDLSAVGGKGGDQTIGNGRGGAGGGVGNNGNAGDGGTVKVISMFGVLVTGTVNVSGGGVGAYNATSGVGGNATKGTEGIGGPGGKLGDNGRAGNGGEITIEGVVDVALKGALLADGGGVGAYSGTGGNGGDGNGKGIKIESVGGDGGSLGNNGHAGDGGKINLTSTTRNLTAQLISASGGTTSALMGTAGKGGDGQKGGAGGSVGGGTSGGFGGTIAMTSNGDITLNDDVRAIGQKGGDVNATAGNGGIGTIKGGDGGTVLGAGAGGGGGTITISADQKLIVTNGVIATDGGNGGDQSGTAGTGGASTMGPGGNGGDVGPAGFGGGAGQNFITPLTKDIKTSAKPGAKGKQNSQPGQGGSGHPNGRPGRFIPA